MIFGKNFARNFKQNNTWSIRPMVNESFVPAPQPYYIEDCRIYTQYSNMRLQKLLSPMCGRVHADSALTCE